MNKVFVVVMQGLTVTAGLLILLINVMHPLFHHFEGGSLDAILAQINHIATFVVAEFNKEN